VVDFEVRGAGGIKGAAGVLVPDVAAGAEAVDAVVEGVLAHAHGIACIGADARGGVGGAASVGHGSGKGSNDSGSPKPRAAPCMAFPFSGPEVVPGLLDPASGQDGTGMVGIGGNGKGVG